MVTNYVDSLPSDRAISCRDPVEPIDGWSLEAELFEGEFNEAAIWQILQNILPLLQDLHDRHEIHGDIRPATIIRQCRDRRLLLTHSSAVSLTSIGSAEYAAPEQLYGNIHPSSDLYSLGMTCLHLLTQLSPFELIDRRTDAEWRDYLSQPISPGLQAILSKLIDPVPHRRYSSAATVLQDVQALAPLNKASEGMSTEAIALMNTAIKTTSIPSVSVFDPVSQQWYCLSREPKLSDTTQKIALFLASRQVATTVSKPEDDLDSDHPITPKQLIFRTLIAGMGTVIGCFAGFCLFICLSIIAFGLTPPAPSSTAPTTQSLTPNPYSPTPLK